MLYIDLIISLEQYGEFINYLILLLSFSGMLSAFNYSRILGNLLRSWLTVNILIPCPVWFGGVFWSGFYIQRCSLCFCNWFIYFFYYWCIAQFINLLKWWLWKCAITKYIINQWCSVEYFYIVLRLRLIFCFVKPSRIFTV